MSSSSSDTALEIELASPWRLAMLSGAMAVSTVCALVLLPLPWTLRAGLAAGGAAAWAVAMLRWWRAAPRAVRLRDDGTIRSRGPDGCTRSGVLRHDAVAGPWTVSLPVRWRDGRAGTLLVSRWMAGASGFRRLKVFLATRRPDTFPPSTGP